MEQAPNPYDAPRQSGVLSEVKKPGSLKLPLAVRNTIACIASVAIFATLDALVVRVVGITDHAFEPWLVPLFCLLVVWANVDLLRGRVDSVVRFFAVGGLSTLIVVVAGYPLLGVAAWFHRWIGGTI